MEKRWFLIAWATLALAKLALALTLPLFGDEAFYWWEGQRLAWSYSDLPPMTAWLARLGSALVPGELGVRLPFLLIALALPWQVHALAALGRNPETAWRAGLLAQLLPLAALLGVLALPDVPMIAASVWTLASLTRALQQPRPRDWWLLGLALATGLLCHYRFAAVVLVVAGLLLVHPSGRAALRGRGPWLAAAVASLGLLPLLWFNLAHDLAGIRFQLLDRHPWAWQGRGWLQLVEQAVVIGPLLLVLLAATAWQRLRQPRLPWPDSVQVPAAVALWLLFFVLGFFADAERFRWHWPLTASLWMLPALAAGMPGWRPGLRVATWASTLALALLLLGYLAAAAMPGRAGGWLQGKRFPANFSGWREVAAWQAEVPATGSGRLVVDNFMLAATLSFYLRPESPVLVLDDPLNRRHGRAAQLAIWGLDERALDRRPGTPGWLLVEETARRFSDRWSWYQGLCARFSGLQLDDSLVLHGGRKRFLRWRYQAYDPRPSCTRPAALPPLGWVELPDRLQQGQDLVVVGWALQPQLGLDRVEVLLNGRVVATPERDLDNDWAARNWGETGDPAGQRLGFRAVIDSGGWPPGRYLLGLRVWRADGRSWLLQEQPLVVAR